MGHQRPAEEAVLGERRIAVNHLIRGLLMVVVGLVLLFVLRRGDLGEELAVALIGSGFPGSRGMLAVLQLWWPLALIAVGVWVMLRARRGRGGPGLKVE